MPVRRSVGSRILLGALSSAACVVLLANAAGCSRETSEPEKEPGSAPSAVSLARLLGPEPVPGILSSTHETDGPVVALSGESAAKVYVRTAEEAALRIDAISASDRSLALQLRIARHGAADERTTLEASDRSAAPFNAKVRARPPNWECQPS